MVVLKGDVYRQTCLCTPSTVPVRDQWQAQGNTRAQQWPGSSWGFHSADVTATEHGEAGSSLAPAPCYWSWSETCWTRCRHLRHIVWKCANSDNGGWSRRNASILIPARVAPHVPLGQQGSLTEQPAPTRCSGRHIVPLLFRKTDGSLVHRQRRQSPCIVLSKNPRKARCNVWEIMPWTEYNETYILHHPPEERSPWKKARAERILRSGKGLCWC